MFSDFAIYGLCPARDEFYLVVCEICGVLVKPQALQQHTGIIFLPTIAMQRLAIVMRCRLSVVCNTRVLWPNGWTDQDETWHAGRPRP